MKQILKDVGLYEYREPFTGEVFTRDRKSLRPTGITLLLNRVENPSYRDIADWARTSPTMILDYYDQVTRYRSFSSSVGIDECPKRARIMVQLHATSKDCSAEVTAIRCMLQQLY